MCARPAPAARLSSCQHAFDVLDLPAAVPAPNVCVLFGSDAFLKGLVLNRLLSSASADSDPMPRRMEGNGVEWRDVADELRSATLFGTDDCPVIVEDADTFVTAHRSRLEQYVQSPSNRRLILLMSSWLKTTRLHKQLAEMGLIVECAPPQKRSGSSTSVDRTKLVPWLVRRASKTYGLQADAETVNYLLDLVGDHLGAADQEFQKLGTYLSADTALTKEHIDAVGSGWRERTTWEVLAAVLEGDAAEALLQLHRLFQSGQDPIGFFGAFSWSLRRFAAATAHSDWQAERTGRRDIPESLRAAGFRDDYGQGGPARAERQLRQLGYTRTRQLYRRLLQTDLRLKGSHSHEADGRRILESLIVELSSAGRPRSIPASS